jgi:hypothetical protein
MTTTTNRTDRTDGDARDTGMTARVTVAWTMAGGVVAGGFVVAALTLAGRLSGNGLLLAAAGMFLLGAAAGFGVGALLGWFGRPADVSREEATRGVFVAALWAIPALAVAFLVTGWVAMTVVVLFAGKLLPALFAGAAWLAGVAMVFGAVAEAAAAVENLRTVRTAPAPRGARAARAAADSRHAVAH